jgi:hypothetical protein
MANNCNHCQTANALGKCAKCQTVSYCSKECQHLDWRKHKLVCRKHLPTAPAPIPATKKATKYLDESDPSKGSLHMEVKNPLIKCGDIDSKFREYAVKTTHENIMKCIDTHDNYDIDVCLRILVETFRDITQYSLSELENHRLNSSKEWICWCDDVLMHYVSRRRVNGQPIPLMSM